METTISFTIMELVRAFLAICAAITGTAAAISIIVKVVNKAKAPDRAQNDRITKLETDNEKHRQQYETDNQRLDALENNTRVTMRALLALLSHGIDGNDVQAMKNSKDEITTLLINK